MQDPFFFFTLDYRPTKSNKHLTQVKKNLISDV